MIQLFLIYSDWALLILRLALGLILIAHGWPKIRDLKTIWKNFTGVIEFFGGIFLIVGFLTQLTALVLAIQFTVIMFWRLKNRAKLVGGYELDLLMLAGLLTLTSIGSNLYSLDSYFRLYLF